MDGRNQRVRLGELRLTRPCSQELIGDLSVDQDVQYPMEVIGLPRNLGGFGEVESGGTEEMQTKKTQTAFAGGEEGFLAEVPGAAPPAVVLAEHFRYEALHLTPSLLVLPFQDNLEEAQQYLVAVSAGSIPIRILH